LPTIVTFAFKGLKEKKSAGTLQHYDLRPAVLWFKGLKEKKSAGTYVFLVEWLVWQSV